MGRQSKKPGNRITISVPFILNLLKQRIHGPGVILRQALSESGTQLASSLEPCKCRPGSDLTAKESQQMLAGSLTVGLRLHGPTGHYQTPKQCQEQFCVCVFPLLLSVAWNPVFYKCKLGLIRTFI